MVAAVIAVRNHEGQIKVPPFAALMMTSKRKEGQRAKGRPNGKNPLRVAFKDLPRFKIILLTIRIIALHLSTTVLNLRIRGNPTIIIALALSSCRRGLVGEVLNKAYRFLDELGRMMRTMVDDLANLERFRKDKKKLECSINEKGKLLKKRSWSALSYFLGTYTKKGLTAF